MTSSVATARAATCLTDAEIDEALGESVRGGAAFVDTSGLPDRPLCSGLTLAQAIQRIRAAAFPDEAVRQDAERAALIAREEALMDAPPSPEFIEAPEELEPAAVIAAPRLVRSTGRKARNPVARSTVRSRAYYSSCREARAAGAAPIRRGAPGYSRNLDRDGDGIACE